MRSMRAISQSEPISVTRSASASSNGRSVSRSVRSCRRGGRFDGASRASQPTAFRSRLPLKWTVESHAPLNGSRSCIVCSSTSADSSAASRSPMGATPSGRTACRATW